MRKPLILTTLLQLVLFYGLLTVFGPYRVPVTATATAEISTRQPVSFADQTVAIQPPATAVGFLTENQSFPVQVRSREEQLTGVLSPGPVDYLQARDRRLLQEAAYRVPAFGNTDLIYPFHYFL